MRFGIQVVLTSVAGLPDQQSLTQIGILQRVDQTVAKPVRGTRVIAAVIVVVCAALAVYGWLRAASIHAAYASSQRDTPAHFALDLSRAGITEARFTQRTEFHLAQDLHLVVPSGRTVNVNDFDGLQGSVSMVAVDGSTAWTVELSGDRVQVVSDADGTTSVRLVRLDQTILGDHTLRVVVESPAAPSTLYPAEAIVRNFLLYYLEIPAWIYRAASWLLATVGSVVGAALAVVLWRYGWREPRSNPPTTAEAPDPRD